jgi:hypothetical protein
MNKKHEAKRKVFAVAAAEKRDEKKVIRFNFLLKRKK